MTYEKYASKTGEFYLQKQLAIYGLEWQHIVAAL